ncbi:MAG: class I SAM-dependent methyltransferase [Acholeplasmataceae bacterium]
MKRIDSIVELLKGADTVLDIGTDHGLVLIEAIQKAYIKKGIGSDINQAPLNETQKHLTELGLTDKITLIQSDGFENIKAAYDVVVITGMGYKMMKQILSKPHQTPNYYVFSPHHELEELRAYLSNHGYEIIDEELVYEKKPYVLLKVIKRFKQLTQEEIVLGPILKTKKVAIPYYESKLNQKLSYVNHLDIVERKRVEIEINFYKDAIRNLSQA